MVTAPKRRLQLLTSAAPHLLIEAALERLTSLAGHQCCAVLSRAHLAREVGERLLDRLEAECWLGHCVMTTGELLAHFGRSLHAQPTLTRLQLRQVIAAIAESLHREDPTLFKDRFRDGRLAESTLRSLVRLFEELEVEQKRPAELEEDLRRGSIGGSLSPRARDILRLYERYLASLAEKSILGPHGFDLLSADAAKSASPPEGVRRFVFVGLDGYGPSQPEVRLAYALAANPHVDEVRIVLVLPDETGVGTWPVNGNDRIYVDYTERVGPRIVLQDEDSHDASEDLKAFTRDPFAYREPPATSHRGVSLVRLPDTSLEIEWVVRRIKDELLTGEIRPDEIAVIDRQMGERAEEFERLFRSAGVPVVASFARAAATIPAVRAILSVFRLLAEGWRTRDLVAVAESPYLPFQLNPTVIARVGQAGVEPRSQTEWKERLDALTDPQALRKFTTRVPRDIERLARDQGVHFARFCAALKDLFGDGGATPPHRWVSGLVRLVSEWNLERAVYERTGEADPFERARLSRYHLDAVNALLKAAHDWLRGWEIAVRSTEEELGVERWYAELEAIAREASVRTSTYPRNAVQLLTPSQAALRRWRRVYVTGLVGGDFPARIRADEAALTQEERRALSLLTADDRAARERLYFHLAVACATERLVLTSSSANTRGQAQIVSPFFAGARLRIDGVRSVDVPASNLVPGGVETLHLPDDVPILGATSYREWACSGDRGEFPPAVRAWLTHSRAPHVVRAWQAERARAAAVAGRGIEALWSVFAGILPPRDHVVMTPSEFVAYEQCHFRYLASRVWRLDPDTEADEAAAYGRLHHRILERLYAELRDAGEFPPHDEAGIDRTISRLDEIAQEEVTRFRSSTEERLHSLDLAFVVDTLRSFVFRDLDHALRTARDPSASSPRTHIESLEERVGTREDPLWVERDGVRFGLFGRIDRLEVVDDERLPESVQGAFLIKDYKSAPVDYLRRPMRYLRDVSKGNLQLPLYAHLVRTLLDRRVFGFGEVRFAQGADPEGVWHVSILPVSADGIETGPFTFRYYRDDLVFEDPIGTTCDAALDKAAQLSAGVAAGSFDTQPDRDCWGCRLGAVCRASRYAWNSSRERPRPRMPLAITFEEYSKLDGEG